ncbi:MAG: UvrD-helicase domain-containing protein [Desulfohalobiaceae bacterium]
MSPQIPDAEQRAAALDPSRSFIVQAPAGSGKTELLTQRTLALLGTVQAPEQVLAITFTRKAAAEMRFRIMQALKRAEGQEQPRAEHDRKTLELAARVLEQSSRLGWELQSSPGRLRIQTIDSLCASLVSRMPLLSRLGGQGRISQNPEQMYMQAALDTVAELGRDSDWSTQVRNLLAHLDNDLDRACSLLSDMLPKREQWLRHLANPESRQLQKPWLEQALAREVSQALQEVRELFPKQEIPRLLELMQFAAQNLHGTEPEQAAELKACAQLGDLPGSQPEALALWQRLAWFCLTQAGELRKQANKNLGFPAPSSSKDPQLKQRFQEMKQGFASCMQALALVPGLQDRLSRIPSLPWPEYSQEQWSVLGDLLQVLRLAAANLHLIFQEKGELDFAEVSCRARQALGSPEQPTDLALSLDYSIQHILIDEFQDTSISQFLLLQSLTAGWTPGDGRTFFAVGDPMQSIYSFREAEVGLFLQARQSGLGHIQLEPLSLQANFRSQAGIVDWVNQAFPEVLPWAEDPLTGSVPYSPAQAMLPQTRQPAVQIHPFFDSESESEAEQVLQLIQQAQVEAPQGTIAVLARSRLHLEPILRALRRARIPYQAVDIDPLNNRQPIQDLISLSKALRHPGHNLAWLSVLRAPWCGLELEDLQLLSPKATGQDVPSSLQDEELLAGLSPEGQARVLKVRPILLQALRQRERCGLRRQVESCWQALGGPACLQTRAEREDADIFLELLQQRFQDQPQELLDQLDQAVQQLFARPEPGAGQKLQLMTMHKAKGLEFDTVILPGLGKGTGSDQAPLLAWLERSRPEQGSDLLLAPKTGTGQEPDPIFNYIQKLLQEKASLEQGRLLYVAATRARQRLHILGQTTLNEQRQPKQPSKGCLLATLWPAVQDSFQEAAQQDPDSAKKQQERAKHPLGPDQTLYRLPPSWRPPEPAPGLQPQASPRLEPEGEDIPFDWAGELVRCVGSCVHGWLLLIAQQGLEIWDADRVRGLREVILGQLQGLGLRQEDLEQGAELVQLALLNTLDQDLGRWILAQRPEAKNEYALSGLDQGRLVSVVMDRTFVDDQGLRWIIDYKTSRHEGGDLQAFLEQERLRYQEQMQRYARLMQAREKRPIRLGLYFPLLSGWREWSPG